MSIEAIQIYKKGKKMGKVKMGRKPKDSKFRTAPVNLKLADDELEKITDLANYLDIPKTVLMRNFILSGLEEAELFKKTGILEIAKGVIKTSEFIKKYKDIKDNRLATL